MPFGSANFNDNVRRWIGYPVNWAGFVRSFWVLADPFSFWHSVLTAQVPEQVAVRTPTGNATLTLRNFESLKTLFAVFCRRDYATSGERPFFFVDIGANIGLASVYFLTRHPANLVRCFEPDTSNLDCLNRNLAAFPGRASVVNCAVAAQTGEAVLYRAESGKHSALQPNAVAQTPQQVTTRAIDEVLALAAPFDLPVVLKLDVEGMEEELVKSVKFEKYPALRRVICESTSCSQIVSRPHTRAIRSGYIEDLQFTG